MLARLFVIFGGLLVLALTAALVGPYFVDWTPYRADFEREASRILGREVTVAGAASARLLPFPSVTFSDVRVAGASEGDPAMTVETFSMDAELAPFLSGEILIFDMRLVRPKGVVEVGEDGEVDWALRPTTPLGARQITIENLTVTDGEITVKHGPSGRSHLLSDIDATISARSLAGPWRFDGTLALDGVRTDLALSTGTVAEDGSIRLRIVAHPADYPLAMELDGDATLEDGRAAYAGSFRLTSVAADEEHEAAANEPAGYRVAGAFELDHERLAATEYRFETGSLEDPYVAEGSAFLDFGAEPEFSIVADGAQVQFDRTVGEAGEAEASGLTLGERVAALRSLIAAIPRPTIEGSVEVNLPAVVAGDTTIREVKLSAEPAKDGWTVKSLGAQLPGRTTLEASGLLKTGEAFGFSGSLLLAVGQPSGFAAWISKDVDEAIRLLPAAGFLAAVDITEDKQVFRDLELILGGSRFRGRIENSRPADARPTMQVELDGGELDLEGLAAFAALFVSDDGVNRLGGHDVDIAIKAGPVSAGGLTAGSMDTALRLREGRIEIDRLSIGDLAGASISATGSVENLATTPSGKLDASILAADLAPLVAVLAERYPGNALAAGLKARTDAYVGLLSGAKIDVVASTADKEGGEPALTVSASGAAGGTEFTLSGTAPADPAAIETSPLSLAFSAKNEDAAALFALYGMPAIPLNLAGPADTVVTARGTPAEGMRTRVILTGETADLSFDGTVRRAEGATSLNGTVGIEATDIEPWMMVMGASLPGMGLGLPVSLDAKADFDEGLLILSGIEGKAANLAVGGDLNVTLKAGLPHLTGALELGAFDLALPVAGILGDRVLGEGATVSEADAVFETKASLPFSADLDVATTALALGPSVSIEKARFNMRLEDSGLRVADFSGAYLGGSLEGLFDLRNNEGTALLSSQLSLTGADLAAVLPGSTLTGAGDFSANLTANGKSLAGLAASLAGSGTAALRNLEIAGLNPDALAPILVKADDVGRAIDAASVEAFAPEIASGGVFVAGTAELAFTVANGVVRAPPVRIETPKAVLTAEVRADIAAGTVGVTGDIAYNAGDDALAGSSPSIGFSAQGPIGAVEGRYDTSRLAQFLTQRALEKEQARVEAMQMALLEKQRLRREVAYYSDRAEARARAAEEQARLEREARALAEEEARRAEEEARLRAEEEERRRAEEEARSRSEQTANPPVAPDRPNDAIERRPLPVPSDPGLPAESGAAAPQDRSAFEVFGRDGRSIDSILRDIRPVQ